MADPFVIETSDLRKHYDGVEALRGLTLQVPARLDLRLPRTQRRRQDDDDQDPARHGAADERQRARVRPAGRRASGERRDPPPHRLRQRREGSLRLHDRGRDDPLHRRRSSRAGAPTSSSGTCRAFELPPDRKVKALSRGMRTKLALLLALCRGAELLILDEPTSGLDPAMTEEVLQALVGHVAGEEMTVFFSSHQIAEVDQIADRVAIIDRGRVVVAGALDDLREQLPPRPAGVRRRRAGGDVPRAGRRARAPPGPRAHGAVERRRRGDRRRGARAEPGVGGRRAGHAERDLSRNRCRRRTDDALVQGVARDALAVPDRPGRC